MAMTFKVNLQTTNYLNTRQPYNRADADNFRLFRSTLIPNAGLTDYVYRDGDTITVSGQQALYLFNNYTQGPFKCLDFVSGTA